MYLGNMVEVAESRELYGQAKHPYTKALFSAIPHASTNGRAGRIILEGDIPSPMNPPTGCHFNPRCWNAKDECRVNFPPITKQSETHQYRCFNPIQ